jgi:vacuolar-type H+-ATPase subunit H
MKLLDLLAEIEEICDTAQGVPFTNKIMVDKEEVRDIVREIRQVLPDEVQQAQFVMNERQRILDQAKHEYELLIKDAEKQAEMMVDQHEITTQARNKSDEMIKGAEKNCLQLKMSTFEYVDQTLYDFQNQVDQLQNLYFNEMFANLKSTFNEINDKLTHNREEVKDLAYKTQVEGDII